MALLGMRGGEAVLGDSVCLWGGATHSVDLNQARGWLRFPSPLAGRGSGFVDTVSGHGA